MGSFHLSIFYSSIESIMVFCLWQWLTKFGPVSYSIKFHCINNHLLWLFLTANMWKKDTKILIHIHTSHATHSFHNSWSTSFLESTVLTSTAPLEAFLPAVTLSVSIPVSQTRFGIQVFHWMMRLSCSTSRESSQIHFLTVDGILWQRRNLSLSSQLAT